MIEFLRKVPLFAGLPEADLRRLSEAVQTVALSAGEVLFSEGAAGDKAYVILEGEIEVVKASSGREVLLAVRPPGDVIGEIALLEQTPRIATVRARTDARLIALTKEQLDALLDASHSAARVMFYTAMSRWRATEAMLRQSERMAQLGTLTAGVAHELNNPAAAVERNAAQLEEAIGHLRLAESQLAEVGLSSVQRGALARLGEEADALAKQARPLDALARSDAESTLESWLEARGVEDPWELAPALVTMGFDPPALERAARDFQELQLPAVLRWLTSDHTVRALVSGIGIGAGRIAAIVKALKSYSFLDRAPVEAVDVQQGLEDTLLILGHKLRPHVIQRDYAQALPKIQGFGSELNQVWTNILDNAADALEGRQGHITLRTRAEPAWVVVDIEDDGPGIPPDIQGRIFDAFFTTKPPGKGTGLGLNISYNIVVHKHRGEIRVDSRPGLTRFEVRLPVNFENR